MSITLIHILGVFILGVSGIMLFFRPAVAMSVGILGSTLFAITLHGVLRLGGGVSAAWLAFTMVGILMLWKKSGIKPWIGNSGDWIALFLGLLVLGSYLYTPSPTYGGHKAQLFFASCIPLYFLGRMCGQNSKFLHQMLNTGAYVSVGTTFLYLIIILSPAGASESGRFGGGMSIMYGVFLVNGIGFQIYWLYRGKPWQRLLAIITILIAIGIVPFTASRGAIMILIGGSAITFITAKNFMRSMSVFILILILLTGVMLVLRPTLIVERFQGMDGMLGSRRPLFFLAAKVFANNPIKGVGVGGFSQYFAERWIGFGDHRSYPHNLWLEIACEQGIIGLLPLIFLTVVAVKRVVRIRKSPDIATSRCLQMLFWINMMQCGYTGDLPLARGFFALSGVLAGLQLQWKAEDVYLREMAYWNLFYPDGQPEAVPAYQYPSQDPALT